MSKGVIRLGMRSSISKVDDILTFLLCIFLGLSTLSIFGVDAFGALLSFSSVMVSFAFLFGQSARNVFEAIIFLFFIHVRRKPFNKIFSQFSLMMLETVSFLMAKTTWSTRSIYFLQYLSDGTASW